MDEIVAFVIILNALTDTHELTNASILSMNENVYQSQNTESHHPYIYLYTLTLNAHTLIAEHL